MEYIAINAFNKVLMDRCTTFGWILNLADMFTITTSRQDQNLIKDFGRISIEDILHQFYQYKNQTSPTSISISPMCDELVDQESTLQDSKGKK